MTYNIIKSYGIEGVINFRIVAHKIKILDFFGIKKEHLRGFDQKISCEFFGNRKKKL